MKRIIIIAFFVLISSALLKAQDYNTGIGLRGGFANGLTIKHFINGKTALEGIFATRWKGFEITGLVEFHTRAFKTERLNWYAGFGAHAGFWDGENVKWGTPGEEYTVLGLDVILGLEYNFKSVPFNISIDWKPEFNLWGYKGFWGDAGALSIRYIF